MEFVQPIRDRKLVDRMKLYLHRKSLRDWCLFVVGINSGLRVSDLLALRVRDVQDDSGKMRDRVRVRESKTGKMKDFPLNETARRCVREYLNSREGVKQTEWLYPSQKGGHLQRMRAWELLNQAARVVGVAESIGTHTMRKTFAYHAYKQGADLAMIQKLLNHSSQAETLRYIGITQENLDDVYMTLDL